MKALAIFRTRDIDDRPARSACVRVRAAVFCGKLVAWWWWWWLQSGKTTNNIIQPDQSSQLAINLTLQFIKYSLESIGFFLEETGTRVIKVLLEQILLLASNLISLLQPLIFVWSDRIQPI